MKVPIYQNQNKAAVVKQPLASGTNPEYTALGRVGAAGENLGVALQRRANERKVKQDKADAQNALNKYADDALNYRIELKEKRGEFARNSASDYRTWHDEKVSEIKATWTHSPESQAYFNDAANNHFHGKVGGIVSHQISQEQAYNLSTVSADRQVIEGEIAEDPFAKTFKDGKEVLTIEDRIKSHNAYAREQLGGSYTQEDAKNAEAKIKTSALAAMVIKDPEKANEYIERWKVDIGARAYAGFMKTSKEEAIKQQKNNVYDIARNMGSMKEAEDYVNGSGLPMTERRSVITALRVDNDRKKQQQKEYEKEVHDSEESAVGEAFLAEDYDTVFKLLGSAKQLSGTELKSWSEAAKTNAKVDTTKTDKDVEAAITLVVNDMISRDVDPRQIHKTILQSVSTNKKALIEKVDKNYEKEIDTGRKLGYKNIHKIIIGDKGLLDKPATGLQNRRVESAQLALDDWVDGQIKDGKRPTEKEIRIKASQLGEVYRLTAAEQIMSLEEQAKEFAVGARDAAAERLRRAAELKELNPKQTDKIKDLGLNEKTLNFLISQYPDEDVMEMDARKLIPLLEGR